MYYCVKIQEIIHYTVITMFDKIRELILSFFTYLFGLLGMVFPTKLVETKETKEEMDAKEANEVS